MDDAFYHPHGDAWRATVHTRGPWDERFQHAGPPSALLARALELRAAPHRVLRITLDLLRPVPIDTLRVRIEPRGGSRVTRFRAELVDGDDRPLIRAEALAMRTTGLPLPPQSAAPLQPGPEGAEPWTFDFFAWDEGYHRALEARRAAGAWGTEHAAMWLRQRCPLVPDEEPTPLQRVLVVADAGSGITAALPLDRYTFLNPDLSVALHRLPRGPWIGLDATMLADEGGSGLVRTVIHDVDGPVGGGLQTLLVEARDA